MKQLLLFVSVAVIGLLAVACDSGYENYSEYGDGQPQIGLRFFHQTDAEGCPISQKESSQSGYTENQLPADLSGGSLNFILYRQQGEKLVETQVVVRNSCEGDDTFSCMLPNAQSFKLFNVPTEQNMHFEVQGFNSLNQLVWIGHNFNVDITEQSDPDKQAPLIDVFMRRVNRMTWAFDCMETERMLHSATLMRDGTSILIAGGVSVIRSQACNPKEFDENVPCDLMVATKQVVLFDSTTGSYTNMAQLDRKRAGHEAVLLSDGRILIMGGAEQIWMLHENNGRAYLEADTPLIHKNAVLYNPAGRGHVDAVINMNVQRVFFSATPIDTDPPYAAVFLIAGGWGDGGLLSSMEIMTFDVKSSQRMPEFRILSDVRLNAPRSGHTATRIRSNHVLFYGGAAPGEAPAEIFVSESSGVMLPQDFQNYVAWPDMFHHDAVAFNEGKQVLITGGMRKSSNGDRETLTNPVSTAMVLNFETNEALQLEMNSARAFHKMMLMPDDRIGIFGGVSDYKLRQGVAPLAIFSNNSFEPLTDSTGSVVNVGIPRMGHTLTKLNDNSIVMVGGAQPEPAADYATKKTILRSTEIYLPGPNEFPVSGQ